jgi:O-antigen ligase
MGNGPGVFNAYNSLREGWVSHNSFLTILVDNGVLGLLAFLTVLGATLARAIASFARAPMGSLERDLGAACLAGVVAYLTTMMLIDDIYFVFATALFWILLALPTAGRQIGRSV